MTVVNYLASFGFHTSGAYAFKDILGMNAFRALSSGAIYCLLNEKITIDQNCTSRPFTHLLARIETLSTSPRWERGIRAIRMYVPVMSQFVLPSLVFKGLGYKNSEILALCLINEICGCHIQRVREKTISQNVNGLASLIITTGVSSLAAYKFSKLDPKFVANETFFIAGMYLFFSNRFSETCISIHDRSNTDRFGKKIFRVLDKLALPISTILYSACAYSREIEPVNIAALLGLAVIGKQIGDSAITYARGVNKANIDVQLGSDR